MDVCAHIRLHFLSTGKSCPTFSVVLRPQMRSGGKKECIFCPIKKPFERGLWQWRGIASLPGRLLSPPQEVLGRYFLNAKYPREGTACSRHLVNNYRCFDDGGGDDDYTGAVVLSRVDVQ